MMPMAEPRDMTAAIIELECVLALHLNDCEAKKIETHNIAGDCWQYIPLSPRRTSCGERAPYY